MECVEEEWKKTRGAEGLGDRVYVVCTCAVCVVCLRRGRVEGAKVPDGEGEAGDGWGPGGEARQGTTGFDRLV